MCRKHIKEKILSKVAKNRKTGCWEWTGGTSGNGRGGGYPRMYIHGATAAVHRVMFVNEFGYIPNKMQVDHICNNRKCVNPKHLEMVTNDENQRRKFERLKRNKI